MKGYDSKLPDELMGLKSEELAKMTKAEREFAESLKLNTFEKVSFELLFNGSKRVDTVVKTHEATETIRDYYEKYWYTDEDIDAKSAMKTMHAWEKIIGQINIGGESFDNIDKLAKTVESYVEELNGDEFIKEYWTMRFQRKPANAFV